MIDLDELVWPRRFRDDTASEWLTDVNRQRAAAGNPPARLVTPVHSPGGYHVAPIELIAALAIARQSSLREPSDPDVWGLRLLGTAIVNLSLFDAVADPLQVDADTESIRGRARGLISEDLGIATGVHIATRTLMASSPGPRYVIDVDNPPPRFRPTSQHRPDYLVVSGIPASGAGTVEFVVECKGRSRSGAPVGRTFSKALNQAEQTHFAGGDRPRPLLPASSAASLTSRSWLSNRTQDTTLCPCGPLRRNRSRTPQTTTDATDPGRGVLDRGNSHGNPG